MNDHYGYEAMGWDELISPFGVSRGKAEEVTPEVG